MKRFVIAFANAFDNEIAIHFKEGNSDVEVAKAFLSPRDGWEDCADNMESVRQMAFDADCLIEVKEIPA